MERVTEPTDDSLLNDMLWADPLPDKQANAIEFMPNAQRGTSVRFGSKPLRNLLAKSKLRTMIRAHEVKPKGYQFHMEDRNGNPSCITIFSAPNYCGQYGNYGALFCSRADAPPDVLTFEEYQRKPVCF